MTELDRPLRRALCLAALWLTAGCGDERPDLPGEEIDCAWFAEDNCWRDSLSALAACLPEEGLQGTLSADGARCTYEDGYEVVFDAPVDLAEDLSALAWDFRATRDGQLCMSWYEPEARLWLLETDLGTFRLYGDGYQVGITCPDGDQYKVSAPGLLQYCNPYELPTRKSDWDTRGVTLTLGGTGAETPLRIFDCRTTP